MKTKIAAFALFAALISGCASVHVQPVIASKYPIKLVYIRQNPTVVTKDFLLVLEDGFQRHGIETKIITGEPPADSDYLLTYSTEDRWDLALYLRHAELRLKQGTKLVASATYHHEGGLGFNKWASTAAKMNPVIDKLLAGFPPQ